MEPVRVAAIRLERRAIAVALFIGVRIDYTQTRQLATDPVKAETSVIGFLQWVLSTFLIRSAALEAIEGFDAVRRTQLTEATIGLLRGAGIPIWQVPKQELLDAFAHPPLRNRKELRQTITAIWPVLNGRDTSPWVLDAAALGLYVQTERLFLDQ